MTPPRQGRTAAATARPAAMLALAAMVVLAAPGGCATPERGDRPGAPVTGAALDPAEVGRVLAAHESRVAKLSEGMLTSATTVRWTEDGREKDEEVDGRLVWSGGGARALLQLSASIASFETQIGTDGTRFWIYLDPPGDDRARRLERGTVGRHAITIGDGLRLDPARLPALLGLVRVVPREVASIVGITRDADGRPAAPAGAWREAAAAMIGAGRIRPEAGGGFSVAIAAGGTPVRMVFPAGAREPSEVRVLDEDGTVAGRSRLRDWRPLDIEGYGELNAPTWPHVALVDDEGGRFTLRMNFRRTDPFSFARVSPRAFDVDRLPDLKGLSEDEIVDLDARRGAAGSGAGAGT